MKRKTIFWQKCGLFLLCFTQFNATLASEPFSIRLKQAPMAATLQQLAVENQLNLVIDEDLDQPWSVNLTQLNFTQFLKVAAKSKGLHLTQENGIYYLSAENHALKTRENATALSVGTHLTTASIKLHFAKASEVMKSLTTGSGSLLSSEGSVSFDDRSNVLIIKDNPTALTAVKKLVAELDKPIEQIAIEARIVNMTDESLEELGVRWGLFEPVSGTHRVTGSLPANGFNNIGDNLNINLGTTNTPAGSIALQVAKIHGRLLDLELTALERENNVKIIASPKLLTTNKKAASIKQGTEIPYISTNEKTGSQSVEFREAVLGLEVTPHISKDNQILMDLVVSQNAPGQSIKSGNGEVVAIDKQEINTQVFAKDGETIVLGGVFQDTISKGVDKVPLLGDIPVVKHLFSKQSERHQKRELVIFVTPHILKQGEKLGNWAEKNEKKKE